mgnify:FL=1
MITTYSAFNYGHTVTDENKYINFIDSVVELTAELNIGAYTLGDYATEIARAMNDASTTQEYETTLDRVTGKITIDSVGVFSLLVTSGTNASQSAFSMMGFNGADLFGLNSYEGDSRSGSIYYPQRLLQSYVDFEDFKKTLNSKVNQSASGQVEVVSYGRVKFMQCNIDLITDITPQLAIKNNPTGVSDYRNFIDYCTQKAPIEFVKDINQPIVFVECLLESTPESKDGVDYTIKELYARKLAGYYESGLLTFRKLD